MSTVKVNIKKLSPEATLPRYANANDAGMDLVATSVTETDIYIEYGTGLAIELPRGFAGLLCPRSSISKYDLVLANGVGVVDCGYAGELKLRFKKTATVNWHAIPRIYQVGDKIAQLIVMPVPTVLFTEVAELEESDRGMGGFGSSGK